MVWYLIYGAGGTTNDRIKLANILWNLASKHHIVGQYFSLTIGTFWQINDLNPPSLQCILGC